MPSLTR